LVQDKGTELVVSWLTPTAQPIVAVETARTLFLVADADGDYLLEVRARHEQSPGAPYELSLQEQRTAEPRDRLRVEAQALQAQGYALDAKDRPRAGELYRRSLELWRRAEDPEGEQRALFLVGSNAMDVGDYQHALEDWGTVIQRAAVSDPAIAANARMLRADLYRRRGDVDAAASDLEAAAAYYVSVGHRQGEAGVWEVRALLAGDVGDLQTVLDAYHRALEDYRQTGDRKQLSSTLSSLGVGYYLAGHWSRARSLYEQALTEAGAIDARREQAIALNNLGGLLLRTGELPAAQERLKQALELRRGLADKYGEAVTLGTLGKAHRAMGQPTEARACLEQSLEIFERLGAVSREAWTINRLAELAGDEREPDRALALYERSLSIQRRLGQRSGEADTLYGMGRLLLAQGRHREAWARLAACLEIVDTLRTGLATPGLRSFFLGSVRDYYEAAVEALMQEGSTDLATRALETSERGRARSLMESLVQASEVMTGETAPRLVEKERSLRHLLDAKAQRRVRLLSGSYSEQDAASLAREIDDVSEQYDEVLAEMRRSSPQYASTLRAPALSAAEIQALLPADGQTVLVEYALGAQRSYAWVVSRQSVTSFALPVRAEIEAAVRRVREEWSRPRASSTGSGPDGPTAAVRGLSDLVIAPLAERLRAPRLIVVPDGPLHYVPFSALWLGGTPLIDRSDVVSVPAASVLSLLGRTPADPKGPRKALAVLADPVFESDDPRIQRSEARRNTPGPAAAGGGVGRTPSLRELAVGNAAPARLLFSRVEARAILDRVPAAQRLEALDFRASRATALGGELAAFRIVHFATHGFVDSANPELSGMVLSLVDVQGREQPGVVSALDVLNLGLRADLVVLSGCQTALGQEIRGEGPMSLARGFLHVGVPTVVASLWSVDDRATATLMKRFYAALLGPRPLSPASALRAAQLELRAQPRWRHPRYWAGFVVYGAGDRQWPAAPVQLQSPSSTKPAQ
jgi:CHAT domain-containing protein/tetratricopeptide (TPR) repeat protein